jgi:hypothetical protein
VACQNQKLFYLKLVYSFSLMRAVFKSENYIAALKLPEINRAAPKNKNGK